MQRGNKVKTVVIGAGFAGLSAAASLAKHGFGVTVLEKNDQIGGRASVFRQGGFVFDKGPSWYWMPDVFEGFFNRFGKSASDYYQLVRLDPSYQVVFGQNESMQLSADFDRLKAQFEIIERGSGQKLERFLKQAQYKYEVGMKEFVYRPSLSAREYLDRRILQSVFRLDMFKSLSRHARQFFRDPRLIRLMEFPVLFLGAMPEKTPALYSMMNYADIRLGTWYPMGGMHRITAGMAEIAADLGVRIELNQPVQRLETDGKTVKRLHTYMGTTEADVVVAAADYNHVEQNLLDPTDRTYSPRYWETRTLAPSSLIYYIGVGKKIKNLLHHNLFFDEDFQEHAKAIYEKPGWPEKPLFYVCCPSKTDPSVAPDGMENLFILIPVAPGLADTRQVRDAYLKLTLGRLEAFTGETISDHIVFKKDYACSDFIQDYNSFKGNAYGLANTLMQTGFLKPSIRSRKIDNLFYTGQLTVPGPGVPPAIISGQVVADYISKHY